MRFVVNLLPLLRAAPSSRVISVLAGGKEGKSYVCVGNLLAADSVVNDMAKTFEEGKGPLAWRGSTRIVFLSGK